MTLRIGWFSTGAGPGSQRQRLLIAAVEAIREGSLDAEIQFVFCNRERGEYKATDSYLDLVESFGVPALTRSSRQFRRDRGGPLSKPGEPLPPWRTEYDREVAKLVGQQCFDIGVLAGYMLIFTSEMSDRFPFLNLHPAEPGGPVGTWQEVIWQLIDQRAERSGVMVHLATEALDRGPMVGFCTYPLRGPVMDPLWEALGSRSGAEVQEAAGENSPLFQQIRGCGAAREVPLVIATLRAVADGRARIEGRSISDGDGRELVGGLDLTAEVDAEVVGKL